MKKMISKLSLVLVLALLLVLFAVPAYAEGETTTSGTTEAASAATVEGSVKSSKAYAAAIAIGIAAGVGAISMGWSITKANDGIARQPEADGKLRTTMILGLVFIETAIIYALIVAILIIFVL